MISAAPASAERSSVKMTDHSNNGQHDGLASSAVDRREDVQDPVQRGQGRPTRGANEAGLRRIVNAMRDALRSRRNIHVTRKEVAQYAGVTPALVTYYFQDKDSLVEAATVPVVVAMVEAVENCLVAATEPHIKLLQVVGILIESYARDAVVIDLYIAYRGSKADELPDLIGRMEAALVTFFDQWLQNNQDRVYDAAYLQKAAIGMCKIVARRDPPGSPQESSPDGRRMTQAEAICAMLLEPMPKADGQAAVSGMGSAR